MTAKHVQLVTIVWLESRLIRVRLASSVYQEQVLQHHTMKTLHIPVQSVFIVFREPKSQQVAQSVSTLQALEPCLKRNAITVRLVITAITEAHLLCAHRVTTVLLDHKIPSTAQRLGITPRQE